MNRLSALIAPALLLPLLIAADPCLAAPSKDETNLMREAAGLDKTASSPAGEAAVVKRIAGDFGVDRTRVAALRGRGLGYGEIAVVLSLAQKLPGGVTDATVEKVAELRQGPPVAGWGEIAKRLGVKLGAAVTRVKKVNNEAHREMKTEEQDVQVKQRKQAGPVPTPSGRRMTFPGEGKDMSRGKAAD